MAVTAEHVKALIRRHLDRDDAGFLSIVRQLAARAAREGKTQFARDLQALVEAAEAPSAAAKFKPVPIAQPRGELAGLMSVSYPDVSLRSMTLSVHLRARLERVVTEQYQRDRLADHGLVPIHRLLLMGPPGTGKSMSAAALAHGLHLPLFTIQLDAVTSKFMGETATKLRQIFDAMSASRGVYLFDEFDSLGSQRSASNDVGEARRTLTAFLQMLEHASPASLVVAATNHPQLLDEALYRRFDLVVKYDLPTTRAAIELIKARLASLDTSGVSWKQVGPAAQGLSHAEVVRAAEAAAKDALLNDSRSVTTAPIVAALRERSRGGGASAAGTSA